MQQSSGSSVEEGTDDSDGPREVFRQEGRKGNFVGGEAVVDRWTAQIGALQFLLELSPKP